MPPDERDAFEDHYFGCAICAEDVKALDAIRKGARERETSNVVDFRPKRVTLPWAAAASLLLLVGYQNAVYIPRIAARVAPPIELVAQEEQVTSETRAEAKPMVLRANQLGIVSFEIVHDPQYVSYRYALRRGSKELGSGPIPVDMVQAPVALSVRPLPAGSYEVVIEGVRKDGNRSEVTRQSFIVQEGPGVRADDAA
ncbi:MAG TPA: hypothetical protein VF111_15110 [Thermoanaerobaculia bacterium]